MIIMPKKQKTEIHDFYCTKCGNKGIPLSRRMGKIRPLDHRKRLYCPICRGEVNHVECRTWEDKQKFVEDFNAGIFKEEAQESWEHCNVNGGDIINGLYSI